MKRIGAFFASMVLLLTWVGCASSNHEEGEITGQVRIIMQTEVLLDTELSLDEGQSAGNAVKKACQDSGLPFVSTGGFYDHFNGIASDAENGWLFYHNDELANIGADDTILKDAFLVEFRFMNYEEAFGPWEG